MCGLQPFLRYNQTATSSAVLPLDILIIRRRNDEPTHQPSARNSRRDPSTRLRIPSHPHRDFQHFRWATNSIFPLFMCDQRRRRPRCAMLRTIDSLSTEQHFCTLHFSPDPLHGGTPPLCSKFVHHLRRRCPCPISRHCSSSVCVLDPVSGDPLQPEDRRLGSTVCDGWATR